MSALIMRGNDDRIVSNATPTIYPGGPHGPTAARQDRFNADLLVFIRSYDRRSTAVP